MLYTYQQYYCQLLSLHINRHFYDMQFIKVELFLAIL